MGTFNTKKILYGSASLIPEIARRTKLEFENEGYSVTSESLSSGGYDISITKGGLFKKVLGMKTALKITLLPLDGNISFEAGVGIVGQQIIPTVIAYFYFWPVILTQMWGLIKQSKLDDQALFIAETVAKNNYCFKGCSPFQLNAGGSTFCSSCGQENPVSAKFCNSCGKKL